MDFDSLNDLDDWKINDSKDHRETVICWIKTSLSVRYINFSIEISVSGNKLEQHPFKDFHETKIADIGKLMVVSEACSSDFLKKSEMW